MDTCCAPPKRPRPADDSWLAWFKNINWTAAAVIAIMVVPSVIGAYITVEDYLYPEQAKRNQIRNMVVDCYTSANPDKLYEIDTVMLKYEGKERKLLKNLMTKYGDDHSSCRFRYQ